MNADVALDAVRHEVNTAGLRQPLYSDGTELALFTVNEPPVIFKP